VRFDNLYSPAAGSNGSVIAVLSASVPFDFSFFSTTPLHQPTAVAVWGRQADIGREADQSLVHPKRPQTKTATK